MDDASIERTETQSVCPSSQDSSHLGLVQKRQRMFKLVAKKRVKKAKKKAVVMKKAATCSYSATYPPQQQSQDAPLVPHPPRHKQLPDIIKQYIRGSQNIFDMFFQRLMFQDEQIRYMHQLLSRVPNVNMQDLSLPSREELYATLRPPVLPRAFQYIFHDDDEDEDEDLGD
ncbi:uncharacterized protein LOC133798390 [Humulus lupulus]|uniref:uncharacterized protein LOC133798390 n=1 Tax=Humulus lupulus TaxID=3486 RepID=UPI002B4053D9|nr:uncharacterized protein LOC133798390 [Humulus lupulus]